MGHPTIAIKVFEPFGTPVPAYQSPSLSLVGIAFMQSWIHMQMKYLDPEN